MPWGRLGRLVSWLAEPGERLRGRVLHGGVWLTALNVTARGLRLLQLLVLAAFLSPRAFGLVGIAVLAKRVLLRVTDLGIDSALIHHPDADVDRYLDTAWLLRAGRGAGGFLVIAGTAPLLAAVFSEPAATPVIVAVGATVLLQGIVDPSVIYFRKEIEGHKRFVYQVSGTAFDLVVSVVAAILLGNVWALVFGLLAGRALQVVVSYRLGSHRPRLAFDREAAAEMLGYGKWVWATSLVVLVATSGDDAFVGWYLATSLLGLYQVAFRLSSAPTTEVADVVSAVAFPAFSKLQDDSERLREAFAKTMRVSLGVVVPTTAGIVLVAPWFVALVLGAQWTPMVPALQVLAVAGFCRAVVGVGAALFRGLGHPRWDFGVNAVRMAVMVLTIWPLTAVWGIAGTGVSIALGLAASLPLWLHRTTTLTGLPLRRYGEWLLAPVVGVAVMAGPVLVVGGPTPLGLGGGILVGALVYTAVAGAIYRVQPTSPVEDVRSLVG